MLKKLFKNEWKSFYPAPTIVMIVLVVFTGIVMLTFTTTVWEDSYSYNIFLEFFSFLAVFGYIFCLAAASFSITLCTAIRFYKNLFTDEGYLMFTLPVKASDLLISKGLVAALWRLISAFVMGLSLLGIASVAATYLGDMTIVEFFREFGELFLEIFDLAMIQEYINAPLPLLFIWMILYAFASFISGILFIYTCICLGQLFTKHKIGGAILSYFGLRFVRQFFVRLLTIPFSTMAMSTEIEDISFGTWLLIMFVSLLVIYGACIGMYYICLYLMTKKLNLE